MQRQFTALLVATVANAQSWWTPDTTEPDDRCCRVYDWKNFAGTARDYCLDADKYN